MSDDRAIAHTFKPDTTLACRVRASPNHGDRRGRTVDALVLHYTGMASAGAALARLCDPKAEVSSHYLVDEAGSVIQLVPEARRAWHAGRSFWQGERDLNSVSIGIEIDNAGHDGGLPDFPEVQIRAVIALCLDIIGRHHLPQERVLAHSDIAPGRKVDPGPRFPWARMAEAGVGIWPDDDGTHGELILAAGAVGPPVAELRNKLARLGFDLPPSDALDASCCEAIDAFLLRYRPDRPAGQADSRTLRTLGHLLRK